MKLNWFHFMPIDKSFFPKLLPPTTAFGSLYTLGINVIVYPKNRGYKNNYFIGIYDVYKNTEKPSINIIEKFWSEMLSCTFFPSLHSWENIFKMLFSFTYKKILVKYDFHTKGGGKTQNRHSSTAVEFSLQKNSRFHQTAADRICIFHSFAPLGLPRKTNLMKMNAHSELERT